MDIVWFFVGVLFFLLMFLAPAFAVWTWVRWWQTEQRFAKPVWRSGLAFAGFCLGSFSALLWSVHLIHAQLIGGFPFYDPLHLRFMRMGFLSALLGLVVSIPGKGLLHLPGILSSLAMGFVWLIAAAQE